MRALIGVLIATAVLVSACGSLRPPQSAITTNPDGLRVFSWVGEYQGMSVECGIPVGGGGVAGRLEGDRGDPLEPAWLRTDDGRRLSVIWPAGYRVAFDPDVRLINDRGAVVAVAGEEVRLPDVQPDSASGTFTDPYIANARVFDGCYAFAE